jgi:hypothetical protein
MGENRIGKLQSNQASFRNRLHKPDRDGAKGSLNPSTISGEDQFGFEEYLEVKAMLGYRTA